MRRPARTGQHVVSRLCLYGHQTAVEKGQQAGVGLDQIRACSGHRSLATILIYRDEHDTQPPTARWLTSW